MCLNCLFYSPFTQQTLSLSCLDTSHVWVELVSEGAANVPFLHYWRILLVKDRMFLVADLLLFCRSSTISTDIAASCAVSVLWQKPNYQKVKGLANIS